MATTATQTVKTVKPRLIVPRLTTEEHAAFTSKSPAAQLSYHGGRLISSVEVITIFWGAAWGQATQSALIPKLNAFFDFILGSALMDVLAEYSQPGQPIRHGQRVGTVTITNSEPGGATKVISDTQIQQQLQTWVNQNILPAPNANTLFFLYLPPGVTSQLDGTNSCAAFCGYHNSAGSIVYALEPFLTCSGCTFGNGTFDSLSKVSSHELSEAITNPTGQGWFDDNTGNEIGDICNGGITTLGGFVIQTEWSNSAGACISIPRGDHFLTTSIVERANAIANLGYTSEGEACFVLPAHSGASIPLHRLFQPSTLLHFYTTNDAERDNAVNNLGFTSEGDACQVFPAAQTGVTPLHRLFQPTTSEHFYTTSNAERDNAVANLGYQNEGDAGFVFPGDSSAKVPFYRMRNPSNGFHFYTTSLSELDSTILKLHFVSEGEACSVATGPGPGLVPLHRLFLPSNGDHFYTTNDAERNSAITKSGYVSEGEACFVNQAQVSGTVPFHRLFNSQTGEHFYTISDTERDNAINNLGFHSEGEACFVNATDPSGRSPFYRLFRTF
jgi:hypothetical protein